MTHKFAGYTPEQRKAQIEVYQDRIKENQKMLDYSRDCWIYEERIAELMRWIDDLK